MCEINYKEMGQRIKAKRKKVGLTQEKLSELVEVAPSYISEIERGTSICSLAVIVKIANVLELNLDNLVLGINAMNADATFKEILRNIPQEDHKLYMDLCVSIAGPFSK